MKHLYPDVPGLGNVAISRHAQAQAVVHRIREEDVARTLEKGKDTQDGIGTLFREHNGVRLVIVLKPNPDRKAKLVATMYRVQPQL